MSALSASDFVSSAAIPKTVTIAGEERQVWFREISDADWHRYLFMMASDNIDVAQHARAFLISRSLCEPDGTLSLDFEKAKTVKMPVLKALRDAFMEVFDLAKKTAGNVSVPGAVVPGSGTP